MKDIVINYFEWFDNLPIGYFFAGIIIVIILLGITEWEKKGK